MAITLGMTCKLFRGTAAGTVGGEAATVEMKNVKDVSISLETGEADVTTRAAGGWRVNVATLKEASIEFGMLYDVEDDDMKVIQECFLQNKPIAMFVSDGNGSGLDCDVMITNFSQEQNLEEGVNISVTAKPTASGRAPSWKTAGALA